MDVGKDITALVVHKSFETKHLTFVTPCDKKPWNNVLGYLKWITSVFIEIKLFWYVVDETRLLHDMFMRKIHWFCEWNRNP